MRISERGQVTIPKAIRDRFGFRPDVEVEVRATEKGVLICKRSQGQHPVDQVMGVLRKPSSTDKYIDEVRGR